MGETLKERLERLSETATQGEWREAHSNAAHVVADDGLVINGCGYQREVVIANAAFCMALANAYRSGDLIPRDAIEALQAEQCAVAEPLEWEVFDYATAWAKSPFGTYRLDGVLLSLSTEKNYIGDGAGNHTFNDIEDAKAAAQADYEHRILSAITLRPVSEVQAEAHAAAIEAAARAVEAARIKGVFPEKHPDHVRTLHTDASRAYLAERDVLAAENERLREALEPFVQHLKENENMDANAKFVLAPWHMGSGGWLSAMDFYKARAALAEGKDG